DFRIKKLEDAVLRGFDRGDIAGQTFEDGTQVLARFAMNPPQVAVAGARIVFPAFPPRLARLVVFDLVVPDSRQNVLIDLGIALADFLLFQPKEVDHHEVAGTLQKVASIAIRTDVLFKAVAFAQPKMAGLLRRDDEAGPN